MKSPEPISDSELLRRRRRILKIARSFGFVGRVEYHHIYSRSGGATYGRGAVAASDMLTVYAEALDRDADPEDFSLEAIVAHERGHQLLARNPLLSRYMTRITIASEEVLASIVGAVILGPGTDRLLLKFKALGELLARNMEFEPASRLIDKLFVQMEGVLCSEPNH